MKELSDSTEGNRFRVIAWRVAAVLLAFLLVVGCAPPSPSASPSPATPTGTSTTESQLIMLQRGAYDPLEGLPPNYNAPRTLRLDENTPGQTHYVVQLFCPVTEEKKSQIRAVGAKVLGYVPDCNYVTRLDPSMLPSLRQLPAVRWVGLFQPFYKVSRDLDQYLDKGDVLPLTIEVFPGEDVDAIAAVAVMSGARVITRSPARPDHYGILGIEASGRVIPRLAMLDGVHVIERFVPPEPA